MQTGSHTHGSSSGVSTITTMMAGDGKRENLFIGAS